LAEGSDTNIVVKDKDGKATTEKIEDFLKVRLQERKALALCGERCTGKWRWRLERFGRSDDVTAKKRNASQRRRGRRCKAQF
jgi:hypothetical protein